MVVAAVFGASTGEIFNIVENPGIHFPRSSVSTSAIADAATARVVVGLMYGPLSIDVARELDRDSALTTFLVSAYAPLITRFEPGVRCKLSTFSDPEVSDAPTQLLVEVDTHLPIETALGSLAGFDTDWLLNQAPASISRVIFNIAIP